MSTFGMNEGIYNEGWNVWNNRGITKDDVWQSFGRFVSPNVFYDFFYRNIYKDEKKE